MKKFARTGKPGILFWTDENGKCLHRCRRITPEERELFRKVHGGKYNYLCVDCKRLFTVVHGLLVDADEERWGVRIQRAPKE